ASPAPPELILASPPSRDPDAATAFELRADVQHELRFPRHSVRLGTAAREHVGRVRAAWRPSRPSAFALAGRADDRIAGAADRWRAERPNVGAARAQTSVFPHGRHSRVDRTLLHADVERLVDG